MSVSPVSCGSTYNPLSFLQVPVKLTQLIQTVSLVVQSTFTFIAQIYSRAISYVLCTRSITPPSSPPPQIMPVPLVPVVPLSEPSPEPVAIPVASPTPAEIPPTPAEIPPMPTPPAAEMPQSAPPVETPEEPVDPVLSFTPAAYSELVREPFEDTPLKPEIFAHNVRWIQECNSVFGVGVNPSSFAIEPHPPSSQFPKQLIWAVKLTVRQVLREIQVLWPAEGSLYPGSVSLQQREFLNARIADARTLFDGLDRLKNLCPPAEKHQLNLIVHHFAATLGEKEAYLSRI